MVKIMLGRCVNHMPEVLSRSGFQEDCVRDHPNYGYFVGKNRRSFYKLKSALNESSLNPLIIRDADHENAFFAKVLKSEADQFVELTKQYEFKRARLSPSVLDAIKWVFGDGWLTE